MAICMLGSLHSIHDDQQKLLLSTSHAHILTPAHPARVKDTVFLVMMHITQLTTSFARPPTPYSDPPPPSTDILGKL